MKEKICLSWEEFDVMINDLANQLKESNVKFDYIFGVPRGGLIPAVMLSHILKIPITNDLTQKNLLIVDDISDTGNTLIPFTKGAIATIYTTPWTQVLPDFYVADKLDPESWIIFPWEDKINEGGNEMEVQTTLDQFDKKE